MGCMDTATPPPIFAPATGRLQGGAPTKIFPLKHVVEGGGGALAKDKVILIERQRDHKTKRQRNHITKRQRDHITKRQRDHITKRQRNRET